MELRQLATFRAVAQTLSFTRAAEALDYAQSSVSAQIQELETELGSPLFERLGRRISLSEAGQRLLPYAERMLRLADEARATVPTGDEPAGTLTIGSPESLCIHRLPPVLSQFHARFPRVQVIFRPGFGFELRRALVEGQADMCFLIEEPLRAPDLVVEPLVHERLLLLAHPDHALTKLASVGSRQLHGEPMLLTESGCSYRAAFERSLAQAGTRPGSILEFSSVEAIKQCVMAGMGITVLPAFTATAELARGQLVALPWSEGTYGLVTQMAWHRDKWISPTLRAFLDLSREVLSEEQIGTTAIAG